MSGVLNWVNEWHRRACPKPTVRAFNVQLGCHLEEIAEMLESLTSPSDAACDDIDSAHNAISQLAVCLKRGHYEVETVDREGFLDSLADQVVTAVGTGYRAKMDVVNAITEVDISNWSKFDASGQPILDANGKVMKGPHYKPPALEGLF